ncbi:biotin synthase [Desulfosalsimonas propionicica]|uniref:Biotin synthase n=1 Tax=Desulfosalsimonas propionicica TaxID=332175 RepID=A0A7W0CAT8_9BACT|nr:[FeFe] hydrogenase H-cluster radical SAM maturase HydE [Desulfosalsimonas propionicica]MBA2882267.1 biotin synthase [Desulfosalsimonas propionicica]
MELDKNPISAWLQEDDTDRLETLWHAADRVRRENVGDAVHLRGLIEFSNHCQRNCFYCGLRSANKKIRRYRMDLDEIVHCACQAKDLGYGTVVLQSGEDPGCSDHWVASLVRTIKEQTGLAVTLSLGERGRDAFLLWRDAGADRYLMRFETSNAGLYARLHPGAPGLEERFRQLLWLRELGYEVGSGVLVGLPGSTHMDLANDILMFAELDLDMIGIGPWIKHESTPLGRGELQDNTDHKRVAASETMTYKMMALARLACPRSNIPSTTALATINAENGCEHGLRRGANVLMPNMTPAVHRADYEIYPAKACFLESSEQRFRIENIGRYVGTGRGDSPNRDARIATGETL